MIIVNIPGKGELRLKYILFDMNGTLTVDGKLKNSTKKKLVKLSKIVKIYILTADTFGTAETVFSDLPVELFIVDKNNGEQSKENFLKKLGEKNCATVGNGYNDRLMLEKSALGISVLMDEGVCREALESSDILVKNIDDAIDLLLNVTRIIATLRK